ncbi:MAG: hypothetical protein AAGD96_08435 [Chloroflexota bacterium]
MDAIGAVEFFELPKKYQDQFTKGHMPVSGRFYPFKVVEGSWFVAILFTLIYLIPALAISVYIVPVYFLGNPASRERIFNDLTSGIGPMIATIILFLILFALVAWMLVMSWRAWQNVRVLLNTKTPDLNQSEKYGIIIDDENFVLRHGDHFADYACVFLPRASIEQSFTSTLRIRTEADKQARYINVVKVRYLNNNDSIEELVFREDFSLSSDELHRIINDWRQV